MYIGCVLQAWSVAEPLRAYIEDINTEKNTTQTKNTRKSSRVEYALLIY